MSFNLCSSHAIVRKAGAYANSTAIASGGLLADYCDKAEGVVCLKCHKDWIGVAPPTTISDAVADAVSDLAAIKVIEYDMGGFTSLNEALGMANILKDNFNQTIKDLRIKELQTF